MKVALVSGCWPPGRCGVGDYTARLACALERQGADVVRFGADARPFGSRHTGSAARALRAAGASVVHIQYPSAGYGRSLLPSLLPVLLRDVPTVVTLHEFSIFKPYRWPWFAPFAYAAKAVVFTSMREERAFARRMPGASATTEVIPIGSNIPRGRRAPRDPLSVCYFGLFMPGKGIEAFFALVTRLRESGQAWRVALIGAPAEGAGRYAAEVVQTAESLGIALHLSLDPDQVADVLQTMAYAYLPGPGGITERRGAVLAALENEVMVVGPIGVAAPGWLRARIIDASEVEDACRVLLARRVPARVAAAAAAATGWDSIAKRHLALYHKVGAAADMVLA